MTDSLTSNGGCPHAPVYQRTPIGDVRVGCPWCKDAELALLRLSPEPNAAIDLLRETLDTLYLDLEHRDGRELRAKIRAFLGDPPEHCPHGIHLTNHCNDCSAVTKPACIHGNNANCQQCAGETSASPFCEHCLLTGGNHNALCRATVANDAAHVDRLARLGCTCPMAETYGGNHRRGCPARSH